MELSRLTKQESQASQLVSTHQQSLDAARAELAALHAEKAKANVATTASRDALGRDTETGKREVFLAAAPRPVPLAAAADSLPSFCLRPQRPDSRPFPGAQLKVLCEKLL